MEINELLRFSLKMVGDRNAWKWSKSFSTHLNNPGNIYETFLIYETIYELVDSNKFFNLTCLTNNDEGFITTVS